MICMLHIILFKNLTIINLLKISILVGINKHIHI